MPMIDLTAKDSEADGQLIKYTGKADGKAEDAYIFDAVVAFTVRGREDAATLEAMIPGACEIFDRATREDDNWRFNTTVKPDMSGVRAVISHAERGKVAVEGACEVKSVQLRASKKATVVSVTMAFGGQSAGVATNLTALLRSTCCLSVERAQQVIPFPTSKAPDGQTGDLVAVWDPEVEQHMVGRLVETSVGGVMTLEDFDNEYAASRDHVVAVVKLGGDVTALTRSYKQRCGRRKITPTWEAVILAAAESAEGLLSGGGSVILTPEIIERAVARLESGDGVMLPPEVDEAADC